MGSPFLNSVRRTIRTLHYSVRTEQFYLYWIKQFILFYNKRHPSEIGAVEVGEFLSYLANECYVSASTQNQALNVLNILYTKVLDRSLGELQAVVRAKRPKRLPVVLSQQEVNLLFDYLFDTYLLMAKLMYGYGLRLMEVMRLTIKDVDFPGVPLLSGRARGARIALRSSRMPWYLSCAISSNMPACFTRLAWKPASGRHHFRFVKQMGHYPLFGFHILEKGY